MDAAENEQDKNGIEQLARRLIPEHSDRFVFTLQQDTTDYYEIESVKDKIHISGNSTISLAVGLNHYLKYYCLTSVSWYADDPIELPEKLPVLENKVHKRTSMSKRFFLNYCTFGYTTPWWRWSDWERLIDWMALNGVNLPLATTGQEAIWYEVWKDYGLSDPQIREYFTGPAHLPWHRMSNLDKWGGPLPHSWLKNQLSLQKQIVNRERELGMIPVLPAFAGHVPAAIEEIYPEAKISKLGFWGGFKDKYRSHFLDPHDPLFPDIQRKFLEKQTEIFGTGHIYGADPFNEVDPPSWEPDYLASVSEAIFESMVDVDPDALWLQMAWIFYFERKHWTNERIEAMVRAVPKNKMILLDYHCEEAEVWQLTESFFKQPFIWCYLGNFGGNTMLAGNLKEVSKRIENTKANAGPNLAGIGATLEALDVNPIMYEFVFEKAWGNGSDLDHWIDNWADRRYGEKNQLIRDSWKIIFEKVYTQPTRLGQATLTNARPTLYGSGNWTTDPSVHYENTDLLRAWEYMLAADYTDRRTYHYDIVNIGRQLLGNHFLVLRERFTSCYEAGDIESLRKAGTQMLDLLADMDKLVATEPSFLAGHWINDARSFGTSEEEMDYYEENARNIITTWGGRAQSLNDYASRSWSGLLSGYYAQRWRMFIMDVIESVERRQSFNEEEFFKKVTTFEQEWVKGKEFYSDIPEGNSVQIGKQLLEKHKTSILKGNTY